MMEEILDPLTPSVNDSTSSGIMNKLRMRLTNVPLTTPTNEGYVEFGEFRAQSPGIKKVGTFAGVFCPVVLSMFSALIFIRMGYLVGNAGVIVTLAQFGMAYLIVGFTVTSICAISTNGAVEGGGVYFMLSRTLGPECGGAIGTLFFFANVVSSALCISACTEALMENFGESGYLVSSGGLPDGDWYRFLYRSTLNAVGLSVSLAGASLFARTSLAIWLTMVVCLASAFLSFFIIKPTMIEKPDTNHLVNDTHFSYTGLNMATFYENLYPQYGRDYTTDDGELVDFASVFGVLFTGVTGVMAGANMSALLFTGISYVLLTFLTAATCSRALLQNNYVYLLPINIWKPFIAVGMLTATFSAGLSNLIGASRVLEALAKDNIFVMAVVMSWLLVQLAGGRAPLPYLLLLDPRREHVKFWRPQMLLLISSPRQAAPLIDFVNDQKKGGLFVIGHVRVGQLDGSGDPLALEHSYWLKLIDHLKVKAFVELCLAESIRSGAAHLTRLAGLGAMKPDTVLLGFRDTATPKDFFRERISSTRTPAT
ncbi:unnamed protein product [Leptidea sinapis]|uniref:Solute carrier family 12 member 9 n=1 Tax=Leptidea sinapis TaxID=189913 RepID=A0A5E4R3A3_9NEOP|nr:unnamed protein product [Leptidea sinapis]